jgi:hypothetical protein
MIQNVYKVKVKESYPRDPLCGLMVRVPGYISKAQGSIPRATRFSVK